MSLQLPLVLPPDVLIIGSSDVSPDMRAACGCGPDDFIITRPRTRVRSWTLSADSAEVLNSFRSPRTIVDVVITLARRHGSAPETVLDETLQLLRPFIEARWLVRADSDEARQIAASLRTGEVVDGFRVLSCLQLLSDTEVYQARNSCGELVALKLVRRGASAEVERMIAHEAEILRHLDGHPAPPLLRSGTIDGQCYLAIAWRTGVRAHLAARRLRHVAGPAGGRGLLGLCRNILDAYALLHSRSVIHGDVHSSNILVDERNGITVLDYGLAQLNGHGVARHHRGVEGFMEPEYAQATLASTNRPQCSPIGEQYALAALFYLLFTGHMYLEFSAEKDVMLRQILVERPRPFVELGLPAWPELEGVLGRALSKEPGQRFPSLAAFAIALGELELRPSAVLSPTTHSALVACRRRIKELDLADVMGFRFPPEFPSCSVSFGASGIALAMYCAACTTGDAMLLAAADAWCLRAERREADEDAFTIPALPADPDPIGPASVYYGNAGLPLVRALIAQAMGDELSLHGSIIHYLQACDRPSAAQDLTLGRAGQLLGCALVLDSVGLRAVNEDDGALMRQLKDRAGSLLLQVSQAAAAPLEDGDYLGIAHGCAGLHYALLIWCEVSGDAPPSHLLETLWKLAACAEEYGQGLRWPMRLGRAVASTSFMESWCHGTPGYVPLWTAAFRAFGEPRFLELAERAAWTTWEVDETISSLCCGYAGRAYALLNLFRHTAEPLWLERAGLLAQLAAEACDQDRPLRYSLYKGALGVAVLAHDLDAPQRSGMPLFELDRR